MVLSAAPRADFFPDRRRPGHTWHHLDHPVSVDAPRLRVFAGPNGSGKSVLKTVLPPPLLGVYLNPDEIEASIRQNGFLDLAAFGLSTTAAELLPAFTDSSLLQSAGLLEPARRLRLVGGWAAGFCRCRGQ